MLIHGVPVLFHRQSTSSNAWELHALVYIDGIFVIHTGDDTRFKTIPNQQTLSQKLLLLVGDSTVPDKFVAIVKKSVRDKLGEKLSMMLFESNLPASLVEGLRQTLYNDIEQIIA